MEQRGPTVTDADVRKFEQRLVAELPEDYRRFLLDLNGGRTAETHCTFTMRRGARRAATVLNMLYSLNHPDESFDLATQQLYGEAEDRLRGGLEVGADDGADRSSWCWLGRTAARCGCSIALTRGRPAQTLASSGSIGATCGSWPTALPSSWPGCDRSRIAARAHRGERRDPSGRGVRLLGPPDAR
jgi:SMI1/KNR4 family protein SUKH-1